MDLFDDTIIVDPNLLPKDGEVLFFPNFFSRLESDQLFTSLLDNIKWQQDSIRFYGKDICIPRLTAWYGDKNKSYTYSGIPMKPYVWTKELLQIKERIEKKAEVEFSSVLLNRYRTGDDSVAWHCDDEPELGINPVIGSVSFGASRQFKLRHLEEKELIRDVELNNGSFLLMKGETQHKWEHCVPKTKKKIGERINLTFRVIK